MADLLNIFTLTLRSIFRQEKVAKADNSIGQSSNLINHIVHQPAFNLYSGLSIGNLIQKLAMRKLIKSFLLFIPVLVIMYWQMKKVMWFTLLKIKWVDYLSLM